MGAKLTELFFQTLKDSDNRPAKVILLNSGVFLTTSGSPVADALKKLEAEGTTIHSCITRLTYYDRLDKLLVGQKAGMKETVNSLTHFKKVVTV